MTPEDVPAEVVEQILQMYLRDSPKLFDYLGVISGLENIRSRLRKFGAEPDELDVIFQPITLMIEENVRARKIALEAQQLIKEFKSLLQVKEDAYIQRVKDILDENIQSGNTGTRILALDLIEKMKLAKDKP